MQPDFKSHLFRRGPLIFIVGLLVGGASWGVAQSLENDRAPVTVTVDSTPLVRNEENSLSPIVKRVGDSVVKVQTVERMRTQQMIGSDPFGLFGPMIDPRYYGQLPQQQQQPTQRGLGSGVIVSPDGYILTNNHVVADADEVTITLNDGREFNAEVIGTDEQTDVAVLKVKGENLPVITFADSDTIEVGDRVLAIGNPFDLGFTVTTGIISGVSRDVNLGVDYADFIQTDAAINPGNSGGALIDMQGRLIGINTAILSDSGGFQGVGFAIPTNLARFVMNSLVRDGRVIRGYLGVAIQDLTPDLAEQFDVDETHGALVSDVTRGTPADRAGLQSGDVILSFAGKPVESTQRLRFAVAATAPGEKVKLEVIRDGKPETLEVTIGELNGGTSLASSNSGPSYQDEGVLNGVGVTDLTARLRSEFNIPTSIQGALVTEVDPSSAAADAGLAAGDVILSINRRPVNSADQAIRLTETSETGKTLLRIWSSGRGAYGWITVDESGAAVLPSPRRR